MFAPSQTFLRVKALALAVSCLAAACGSGASGLTLDPEGEELKVSNGMSTNGLSTNGMSTNGMSTNGLSTNGLSTNGLSTNGMSTNGFSTWFLSNPASYSDMVMKYVVRCAVPAGQSLSHTSAGVTYTWPGNLGLAPVWASGQPIPLAEQELVSACLAAHANKYGVEVAISVRGFQSDGATQIAYAADENTNYSVKEGCFFGNLFDGSGVFSAYENSALSSGANSSYRACAYGNRGVGQCQNLPSTAHQCSGICHQLAGAANTGIWNTCDWGGKTWRPITVRLLPTSVNVCGDGICQATETCFNKATGYGCQADCGKCE